MRVAGKSGWQLAGAAAALTLVGACAMQMPPATSPRPPAATNAPDTEPSARSKALARYYAGLEQDLLSQGLLRTDGGGPDTPWTDTQLERDFERIAFYDEYAPGQGYSPGSSRPVGLRKWDIPVRMNVIFGKTVKPEQRARDRKMISGYVARLARITRHPIRMSRRRANFHVLVMGEDDRDQAIATLKRLVPDVSRSAVRLFRDMPRSIHCLVLAFSGDENDYSYANAVALIRNEHPPLLRTSCVHEELAQGLGLANDSPKARPSIFNDDDEFALLTRHDEALLRILYNPALRSGMPLREARPVLRRLVQGKGSSGAGMAGGA